MSTRVFVGGLTHRVRERDLEKFFRKYGRIREVSLKNGYAFVEFDDHRDADDACYELNGRDLMGERITVERARGTPRGSDQYRGSGRNGRGYGGPPRRNEGTRGGRDKYGPPTRTEFRVIVENLSSRCSWQDLKDYMRKAGEVMYLFLFLMFFTLTLSKMADPVKIKHLFVFRLFQEIYLFG